MNHHKINDLFCLFLSIVHIGMSCPDIFWTISLTNYLIQQVPAKLFSCKFLQKILELLHLRRPVEVFLSKAAHLLRMIGVGADFLYERQNLLDIDGAFVCREVKNVGKICSEVWV